MPRANRHHVPGQLWHITHRCHDRSFLLKFARDRRCYLSWLCEARKRLGLCVLNYVVTSNHIHLLVREGGDNVLARSMQLVAGRTARAHNQRKNRHGAFWEDRYHATAVEANEHLHRCLVYIDLNMVRAGVVRHPADWVHGGYKEIQGLPERCSAIDLTELSRLSGFLHVKDFQQAHAAWVSQALAANALQRDERWSEAIAVGGHAFVQRVKDELGIAARHRGVENVDGVCALREPTASYNIDFDPESELPRAENTRSWQVNSLRSEA